MTENLEEELVIDQIKIKIITSRTLKKKKTHIRKEINHTTVCGSAVNNS